MFSLLLLMANPAAHTERLVAGSRVSVTVSVSLCPCKG